ncbi:uncharacterized protein LOC143542224 [Bidens hawaiensis]|uniref:uncharacterized protein LOC143542224 n=1 Tax=Bidens hawaiensis TaxID=980011 RepID=UPI00404A65C6
MHSDQESNMIVQWTRDEHSMFVNVVANGSNGLEEIAGMIPGQKPDEVKAYYEAVAGELLEIEAGRVELPDYPDGDSYPSKAKKAEAVVNEDSGSKPREKERKKANPWTVEEHKRFLDGLKKYGKGDWRSISRMAVITRTATQVASHAQKFFLRQTLPKEGNNNNKKRKKKRYSIHDITTTDDAVVVHAQPSSTTSSPSDLSGEQSNGSQERVAQSSVALSPSIQKATAQPMSSTLAATSFYDSKGKGVQATTSSSHYFNGGQYYGGQGIGALPPLITLPSYSICGGQGGEAPQPFSSYYDGQGGAQPEYELSFYNGYPGENNF